MFHGNMNLLQLFLFVLSDGKPDSTFPESALSAMGLKQLVHFEKYDAPGLAIQREKNIKHWSRAWKIELVESSNPQWRDLYTDITR
jgi:putative endonuclease